jgi:hypothetical protein
MDLPSSYSQHSISNFHLSLIQSTPLAGNVLALGAVADFGAQNCQYTTKVYAR